jgi:hypothetical protein
MSVAMPNGKQVLIAIIRSSMKKWRLEHCFLPVMVAAGA